MRWRKCHGNSWIEEPNEEVVPTEYTQEAEPDEGEEIVLTEVLEIEPIASNVPEICVSTADNIWTDSGDPINWMIKITIPKQEGCVRIDDSKDNLTPAEMSALDTSEHEPVKALINFCVAPIVGECTERTFHPPMKIEVKHDPDSGYILLYASRGKWLAFADQGKRAISQALPEGKGLLWARITNWSSDPQVAWGR